MNKKKWFPMLLMAAMCVLGFTSCSDDDDIGDNPDTPSKEIPLTRMTTLCSIAIPQEHAVCFTTQHRRDRMLKITVNL